MGRACVASYSLNPSRGLGEWSVVTGCCRVLHVQRLDVISLHAPRGQEHYSKRARVQKYIPQAFFKGQSGEQRVKALVPHILVVLLLFFFDEVSYHQSTCIVPRWVFSTTLCVRIPNHVCHSRNKWRRYDFLDSSHNHIHTVVRLQVSFLSQ